jgi:hypothetical protein
MTDRTTYRSAVVVFVEAKGADERDAGNAAELAVRQALAGPRLGLPADIILKMANRPDEAMTVVDVMEVGLAAGNGYLWTRPTSKAFREYE